MATGILDDTCKQDSATDETFCERLVKQWDGAKDANGPSQMLVVDGTYRWNAIVPA